MPGIASVFAKKGLFFLWTRPGRGEGEGRFQPTNRALYPFVTTWGFWKFSSQGFGENGNDRGILYVVPPDNN